MLDTCTLAVFGAMNSLAAISRLLRPSASSSQDLLLPRGQGRAARRAGRWTAAGPIRARLAQIGQRGQQRDRAEPLHRLHGQLPLVLGPLALPPSRPAPRPAASAPGRSRRRTRGRTCPRTACQAAGLFLPRARAHSASARGEPAAAVDPQHELRLARVGGPWRATAISALRRLHLGLLGPRVAAPARARAARFACARQADRGDPDHRRPVAVLDRPRGDARPRPPPAPSGSPCQSACSASSPRAMYSPNRSSAQNGSSQARRPHHRVALAHLDEQGHGREPGLGDRWWRGPGTRPRAPPRDPTCLRCSAPGSGCTAGPGRRAPGRALLLRPRHALVSGRDRARQVAALQPDPGELVRGAQLDAEHLRVPGLVVRRGEQARSPRRPGRARSLELTKRHQGVRLHPGRRRPAPPPGPRLRHGGRGFLVPGVHEGLGAGWPAPGPAPRRAGPRQRVDGRLGGLHRVGDRRQSPAGSSSAARATRLVSAGSPESPSQDAQPPQLVHRAARPRRWPPRWSRSGTPACRGPSWPASPAR